MWAVAFMMLGLFETLDAEWRLLSGFIVANGLILFSLSTAFLIELMRRLGDPRPNGG